LHVLASARPPKFFSVSGNPVKCSTWRTEALSIPPGRANRQRQIRTAGSALGRPTPKLFLVDAKNRPAVGRSHAIVATPPARVAKWQTRQTQNLLSVRTCRFKSGPGHTHTHRLVAKRRSESTVAFRFSGPFRFRPFRFRHFRIGERNAASVISMPRTTPGPSVRFAVWPLARLWTAGDWAIGIPWPDRDRAVRLLLHDQVVEMEVLMMCRANAAKSFRVCSSPIPRIRRGVWVLVIEDAPAVMKGQAIYLTPAYPACKPQ
jgi:hypothetical protein